MDDVQEGIARALVTTALIDLAQSGAADQASVQTALRALKTQGGAYKAMLNVVAAESVVFNGKHPDAERIQAMTAEARAALRTTLRSEGSAWLTRYVQRKNTLGVLAAPTAAPTPPPPPEEPLSDRPKLVDAAAPEQFVTHLPLYSLTVVAASQPAGEWGPSAHDSIPERLGWARVTLRDRKLTCGMFLARVRGHSMDDGRTGLRDGVYAVFEFGADNLDGRPIVLVRGAFRDPETGSYAVKELSRTTDAEGAVTAVTLRSRNPDGQRFPAIELDATRPESVQVIARFVEALSPDAIERAPRKKPTAGLRDLSSDEGIDRLRSRLERSLDRYFDGAAPEPDGGESPEIDPGAAWLELAATGSQRNPLEIVLSKLGTLSPDAGAFRLNVGDVVASAHNLSKFGGRFTVPPSTAPYTWAREAGDDGTSVPGAAGLSDQHATAFRVDASDLGQQVVGTVLAAGRTYRLLIPPTLAETARCAEAIETHALSNGWCTAEIELAPVPLRREVMETLEHLGLALGTEALSVEPVGDSPARWLRTQRGERVAGFAAGAEVVVRVRGPKTHDPGEVVLFALGPEGLRRLELPAGDEWFVALGGLRAGRYAVHVEHARTAVASDRWIFAVEDAIPSPPVAEVEVCVGDDRVAVDGRTSREGDFAALALGGPWTITTPPLWRLDLRWSDRWLGALTANAEGQMDTAALRTLVQRPLTEDSVGDLALDFGDLGSLVLRHTRVVFDDDLVERLAPLVKDYGAVVGGFGLDLAQLLPMWIQPLCRALGYSARTLEDPLRGAPPPGMVAFALDQSERTDHGVRARCVAALVVSLIAHDVDTALGSYVHGLSLRLGVHSGFYMVGTSWRLFRGKRPQPPVDLVLHPMEFVQAFRAEEP